MRNTTKHQDTGALADEVSRENDPDNPVVQELQRQVANAFVLRPTRPLLCIVLATGALAEHERLLSVRLVDAPSLTMPGAIDSNVPMAWVGAVQRVPALRYMIRPHKEKR